jgi:hypothetical protein
MSQGEHELMSETKILQSTKTMFHVFVSMRVATKW